MSGMIDSAAADGSGVVWFARKFPSFSPSFTQSSSTHPAAKKKKGTTTTTTTANQSSSLKEQQQQQQQQREKKIIIQSTNTNAKSEKKKMKRRKKGGGRRAENEPFLLRVSYVDRISLLRDMLLSSQLDVYVSYRNTGRREEKSKKVLIEPVYSVKERSWKTLWNVPLAVMDTG
jgi:hypothetical protein